MRGEWWKVNGEWWMVKGEKVKVANNFPAAPHPPPPFIFIAIHSFTSSEIAMVGKWVTRFRLEPEKWGETGWQNDMASASLHFCISALLHWTPWNLIMIDRRKSDWELRTSVTSMHRAYNLVVCEASAVWMYLCLYLTLGSSITAADWIGCFKIRITTIIDLPRIRATWCKKQVWSERTGISTYSTVST